MSSAINSVMRSRVKRDVRPNDAEAAIGAEVHFIAIGKNVASGLPMMRHSAVLSKHRDVLAVFGDALDDAVSFPVRQHGFSSENVREQITATATESIKGAVRDRLMLAHEASVTCASPYSDSTASMVAAA